MPRLRHLDDLGTARFLTFSCNKRLPLLSDALPARTVLQQVTIARKESGFKIFAYVVMPEHVHLVLYPPSPLPIGKIVGRIKQKSGFAISRYLQGIKSEFLQDLASLKDNRSQHIIWLPRCYDHNCRTLETVIEKINCCHYNPVRRGLVNAPEEWPWSSYRYYQRTASCPIEVDELTV